MRYASALPLTFPTRLWTALLGSRAASLITSGRAFLAAPLVTLVITGFALVLVAAPAAAQVWVGPASIRLQVLDDDENPVDGAQVRLLYFEVEPAEGPAVILTDSEGYVDVVQLAEGRWRVDIEAGELAPYVAVVRVNAGERPDVIAGPIRGATGEPMEVEYAKPPKRRSSPPPRPAPVPPPAPEPVPPPTPQPVPQPVPPTPAPTPEPVPEPVPPSESSPDTAAPSTPESTPAPPTTSPEAPVSAPETAPEPAPAPTPPAASEAAPIPQPAPVPVPVPAPAPERTYRWELQSFTQPNCPGCKAGEWALTLEQPAGSDGQRCPRGTDDLEEVLEPLVAAVAERGELTRPTPLRDLLRLETVAALAPHLDPAGGCQLLAVVLPKAVPYVGYRYAALDANNGGDCQVSETCPIGDASWSGHPEILRSGDVTLVWSLFENRSRSAERRGLLIIYFQPPSGWSP